MGLGCQPVNWEKLGVDKRIGACYNTQALGVRSKYRGVEQLEARRAHNPEVVGSSPASATIKSTENNLFSVLFICFGRTKGNPRLCRGTKNSF